VIFGGGFVYFIGSLYTIFFGLLVVVVEVKDKTAPVSAAYDWLHVYLKFLTFQRGKGTFYLGVGLLLFFIGPACTSFCIGVVNLAAMCLIAVGLLHTYATQYLCCQQRSTTFRPCMLTRSCACASTAFG